MLYEHNMGLPFNLGGHRQPKPSSQGQPTTSGRSENLGKGTKGSRDFYAR